MTQGISDLVRGLLLMLAIGLGGYAWGTPGSQPWAAFFAGAVAVIYVQSGRWFSNG